MNDKDVTLLLLDYMYRRHMRRHYTYLVILGLTCLALVLIVLAGHVDTVSHIPAVAGIQ